MDYVRPLPPSCRPDIYRPRHGHGNGRALYFGTAGLQVTLMQTTHLAYALLLPTGVHLLLRHRYGLLVYLKQAEDSQQFTLCWDTTLQHSQISCLVTARDMTPAINSLR